jgi:hypothetical protein
MSSFSFAPGDYLRSETKLLWVEELHHDCALLEDCYSGELIVVPLAVLFALRPVRLARRAL